MQAVKAEAEEKKLAGGTEMNQDVAQMTTATTTVFDQLFQVMDYMYREDLKYVDDYR